MKKGALTRKQIQARSNKDIHAKADWRAGNNSTIFRPGNGDYRAYADKDGLDKTSRRFVEEAKDALTYGGLRDDAFCEVWDE